MSELSNAVAPTFNKTIKRLGERDQADSSISPALRAASIHLKAKPDTGFGFGSAVEYLLDPSSGNDGVIIFPVKNGSIAAIVQNKEIIWSGTSDKFKMNTQAQ